jgi:5-carboxymethyl-2-hydroxymuconate isomerase
MPPSIDRGVSAETALREARTYIGIALRYLAGDSDVSREDAGAALLEVVAALASPESPLDEEHCCGDLSHMSPEYLARLREHSEAKG